MIPLLLALATLGSPRVQACSCDTRPRLFPPDGAQIPPRPVLWVLNTMEDDASFGPPVLLLDDAGQPIPTSLHRSGGAVAVTPIDALPVGASVHMVIWEHNRERMGAAIYHVSNAPLAPPPADPILRDMERRDYDQFNGCGPEHYLRASLSEARLDQVWGVWTTDDPERAIDYKQPPLDVLGPATRGSLALGEVACSVSVFPLRDAWQVGDRRAVRIGLRAIDVEGRASAPVELVVPPRLP